MSLFPRPLTSKVLVLPLDGLKVLLALVVDGLETEQLSGVVAAFLLGGVKLGRQVVNLELPFADDLVEVALLLLHGVGKGLGLLDLDLHVLDLGAELLLKLLEDDALGVELLDGLLGFGQSGLELAPWFQGQST